MALLHRLFLPEWTGRWQMFKSNFFSSLSVCRYLLSSDVPNTTPDSTQILRDRGKCFQCGRSRRGRKSYSREGLKQDFTCKLWKAEEIPRGLNTTKRWEQIPVGNRKELGFRIYFVNDSTEFNIYKYIHFPHLRQDKAGWLSRSVTELIGQQIPISCANYTGRCTTILPAALALPSRRHHSAKNIWTISVLQLSIPGLFENEMLCKSNLFFPLISRRDLQ